MSENSSASLIRAHPPFNWFKVVVFAKRWVVVVGLAVEVRIFDECVCTGMMECL